VSEPLQAYCAVCKQHTLHRFLVSSYADQCSVCYTQTSRLERTHTENLHYTAPDGVEATVVENTPITVTFYIPSGEHQGYYYYDKGTGKLTTTLHS
jgi:hypothetical protein